MSKVTVDVDKDVKIPAGILAAAAKADEIHKAAYTTVVEDAPAPAPEVTPEVTPAPASETTFAPKTEAEPPAEAPKAEEKPRDEASWEHAYKSMKGRFDRSQAQIKELSDRVAQLTQLAYAKPAPTAPKSETSFEPKRLLTPQEEEEFGTEFLGVVGKKAKEELLPEVEQLRSTIKKLEERFEHTSTVQHQDAQSAMIAKLTDAVPNWTELNTNQSFLNWLALPDSYSGAIRHELLTAAYNASDASRVVAFFKGFLAEEAAVAPPVIAPSLDKPEVTGTKVPLENLAAPGRAKTAATSTVPAEKPIITRAQIAEFYVAVNAGKYRTNATEKARIEDMIFEAQREGRIR